jgi:hypothetical protein
MMIEMRIRVFLGGNFGIRVWKMKLVIDEFGRDSRE